MNYFTDKWEPDLSGPFCHDMGARGPKMQVQHNDAIQHHHSDQYHDKHQIPVKSENIHFYYYLSSFILIYINIYIHVECI